MLYRQPCAKAAFFIRLIFELRICPLRAAHNPKFGKARMPFKNNASSENASVQRTHTKVRGAFILSVPQDFVGRRFGKRRLSDNMPAKQTAGRKRQIQFANTFFNIFSLCAAKTPPAISGAISSGQSRSRMISAIGIRFTLLRRQS
jgi:hypothetical protein